MLLTKTILKAEKLTGQKILKNENGQRWVEYKGYTISFYPNGREEEGCESTGFYTKKIELKDDSTQDYFAGTFHDNITQAFNFINKKY